MAEVSIVPATTADDLGVVRALFAEYATSIGVDLAYQGFAAELASLPGAYAAPRGRLFLVRHAGQVAACVGLRPFDPVSCEMKRLYVRPAHQGLGIGRLLAGRLIAEARSEGYHRMLLDTLPTMAGALRLYESLGFVERSPYYPCPIAGNVFMELNLGLHRPAKV